MKIIIVVLICLFISACVTNQGATYRHVPSASASFDR